MSHWVSDDNWLEAFKRKLQFSHKDLQIYLNKVIEESSLEFIDVQACALSASLAAGQIVLSSAIENELGLAREKVAAKNASAMAALNSSWVNFLVSSDLNSSFFDPMPDVILPYGGVNEVKFSMYLLSSSIVYSNKLEIERLSTFLKDHLEPEQILDIGRIASVIHAVVKSQV